jgi:hypothetical protein
MPAHAGIHDFHPTRSTSYNPSSSALYLSKITARRILSVGVNSPVSTPNRPGKIANFRTAATRD